MWWYGSGSCTRSGSRSSSNACTRTRSLIHKYKLFDDWAAVIAS
jgi:hypothetical protein